jgi:hypothetical protein
MEWRDLEGRPAVTTDESPHGTHLTDEGAVAQQADPQDVVDAGVLKWVLIPGLVVRRSHPSGRR